LVIFKNKQGIIEYAYGLGIIINKIKNGLRLEFMEIDVKWA